MWKSRWPLGLDMLLKGVKYARARNTLQFFFDVFEETGTTFEQVLLGARGIDTVDPENIEAVLSTNFDGWFSLRTDEQMVDKVTDNTYLLRLQPWSASYPMSTSVGKWYLHPRRRTLEALKGTLAPTVCLQQVPKFRANSKMCPRSHHQNPQ